VLNAYRTDVAKPKVVEKELVIGVSQ
jgi:hypothetical protein